MANGQQLSEQNFVTFSAWVAGQTDESFRQIANRGVLSRKEIAAQCGFSKSALDQNPRIKAALLATEVGLRARGVLPQAVTRDIEGEEPRMREMSAEKSTLDVIRLKRLEQENASLRAENGELKKQLARFSVMQEALALTGRIPR
nr:VPA1267 family protein [uncultured Undibacterium sp.]